MCGIVGLFAKTEAIEERLGAHLGAMLVQMDDRGPDSAGVAVYRDPAPPGASKLTLYSADPLHDWAALAVELARALGGAEVTSVRSSHAVLVVEADAREAEDWVRLHRPDLRVMSAGSSIEIYKEVGRPEAFERSLRDWGVEPIGHHWFRDHHHYRIEDVQRVRDEFPQSDWLVTTEKDAVKLAPLDLANRRIAVVKVAIDLDENSHTMLRSLVSSALARKLP